MAEALGRRLARARAERPDLTPTLSQAYADDLVAEVRRSRETR